MRSDWPRSAWCVSRLPGAAWECLLVVPAFFFSNLFE
jgi:hypothetical protein